MTHFTAPFPVIGFAARSGTGKTTLLARLLPVLVEGFRQVAFPKIELHRAAAGKALLYPNDESIIAIASDESINSGLPCLDINQPEAITVFILDIIAANQTGTRT